MLTSKCSPGILFVYLFFPQLLQTNSFIYSPPETNESEFRCDQIFLFLPVQKLYQLLSNYYIICHLYVPSLTITFCLIGLVEIRDILLKDMLKFPRKNFMSVYPTNMQFTSTVKRSSFMRPSTRKRKMTSSTDACQSNKNF